MASRIESLLDNGSSDMLLSIKQKIIALQEKNENLIKFLKSGVGTEALLDRIAENNTQKKDLEAQLLFLRPTVSIDHDF